MNSIALTHSLRYGLPKHWSLCTYSILIWKPTQAISSALCGTLYPARSISDVKTRPSNGILSKTPYRYRTLHQMGLRVAMRLALNPSIDFSQTQIYKVAHLPLGACITSLTRPRSTNADLRTSMRVTQHALRRLLRLPLAMRHLHTSLCQMTHAS